MNNLTTLFEVLLTTAMKDPWKAIAVISLLLVAMSLYAVIVVAQSFAKGKV
jgi:hypothetical protein